jgi:hypothetical protein
MLLTTNLFVNGDSATTIIARSMEILFTGFEAKCYSNKNWRELLLEMIMIEFLKKQKG